MFAGEWGIDAVSGSGGLARSPDNRDLSAAGGACHRTAARRADREAVDGLRLSRYLSTGRARRDLWAALRLVVARIGASASSAWAEVAVDMRGL